MNSEYSIVYRFAKVDDRSKIMFGRVDIMEIEDGTRKFVSPEIEEKEWDLIDFAITNSRIIVAEKINAIGKEVIGFIWFIVSNKCPYGIDYTPMPYDYLWVSQVWTQNEYRNNGIGKHLYDEVIKYCKINKISEIWLDVHNINKKSMSFHTKIGFESKISLLKLCV